MVRVITVPLKRGWWRLRRRRRSTWQRARRAVKFLKAFIERHFKKRAWISPEVNEMIWERGIRNPPRRIRVRVEVEGEVARVYPVREDVKEAVSKEEQ